MSDTKSAEPQEEEQKIDQQIQQMLPTKEIIERVENPPPTRENIDHKQQIIFKIQKYQDSRRFGHIVREQLKFNQPYDELDKMPIENLENMLSRIRIHLDNKNLDRFYDSIVKSGAVAYEQIVSPFYDIEGFADILTENEEFWWTWERFKIENNFPAVNSTSQMLFMIAQATLMAHHMPREYEPTEMQPPPPVDTIIANIENDTPTPLPTIDENKELIIVDNDKNDTTKKEKIEQQITHLTIGSDF